jgi:hypothetical protein
MSVHRVWEDLFKEEYNFLCKKLAKWTPNLRLDLDIIKLTINRHSQSAFDASIIAQILTKNGHYF